jgi:hypothetical protein
VNEIKIPYGSRGGVNRCDLLCAAAPEEAAQKYGVPLEKNQEKRMRDGELNQTPYDEPKRTKHQSAEAQV